MDARAIARYVRNNPGAVIGEIRGATGLSKHQASNRITALIELGILRAERVYRETSGTLREPKPLYQVHYYYCPAE